MRRRSKIWLSMVSWLIPAALYAQASVEWNVDGSVIAGMGCEKDVDTFVASNGNDLSVVFTRLGIDLPGNASPSLGARTNCTLRIPATIASGLYIGQLTQRLSYGVTKSARTTGAVATRSTFFGYPVSPFPVQLPYGQAINEPLLVQNRVDNFSVRTTPSWYSGWCSRTRAPKGLYQANIAVTGQKDSSRENLIMFVDGLDLKFEVVAGLIKCQL